MKRKSIKPRKQTFFPIFIIVSSFIIIFIILFGAWLHSLFTPIQPLFKHLPGIAGFYKEQTYLIIFQNNAELRPTGGFISTFGIAKTRFGRLVSFKMKDSYCLEDHSNLKPPPPAYQFYLRDDPKFKGWYFRDGNSFAQYPSTAKNLIKLYNEQSGTEKIHFDGVFAINFSFLEDIIDLVGGIEIDETRYDKDTLFSIIQYKSKNIDKHNAEALKERKGFMKPIADKLMSQIFYKPSIYNDVLNLARKHLDMKNILLNFTDETIQKDVMENNWGGVIFPEDETKNWVHVNTANLGGRKADRYMQKNIEYHLSLDKDNKKQVEIIITFLHRGTYNLNSDLYRAHIRVFMPKGSILTKNWGDFFKKDTGEENDYKYIGNYIKLFPGERRILRFIYKLNDQTHPKQSIDDIELNILKQPGAIENWQVSIRDITDHSFTNTNNSDVEFMINENTAFWSGAHPEDIYLSLQRKPDNLPPLVTWQGFHKFNGKRDLNKIVINFSEAMSKENLKNPENYEMIDLNYINKETDSINIDEIQYGERENTIFLKISGITGAEEERYKLIMKNLHDLSGNPLDPNPMEITLVQRLQ